MSNPKGRPYKVCPTEHGTKRDKENKCYGCRREWHMRSKYGIEPEKYTEMYIKQGGKCAICETHEIEASKWKRLAIDHDHVTGQIRGLLCIRCNVKLGVLEDKAFCTKASLYISGEII